MHSRQRWCDGGAVEPCSNLSLLQTIMMWWYDVTVIWRYEDMKMPGPGHGRLGAALGQTISHAALLLLFLGRNMVNCSDFENTAILETYCEILLSPSIFRLSSDIHETFPLDPEPWKCLLSNLVSSYKTCNRKGRSFLELQQPLKFSFLLLNGQPFTERNEAIFVEIDEIIKRIFLNLKLFLTCAETGIAVQM